MVNFAEDDTSSESFYIQSLLIALSVMKARGEIDNYDALVAELQTVPQALLDAKRAFEPKAEAFAGIIAGADYHMFTGAGNHVAQRRSTTRPASLRRCSGSVPARCTPPISSTARSS